MKFFKPKDYQDRINQIYVQVRERLTTALPFAEIEHVGSSAIVGAVSKGDLDVLVRVTKDQFKGAIAAIESLGFSIKKDTLRTESLCMFEGPGDVAIQLIERGSKFEMFVRFRDLMNANPDLVQKYNELKLSCSGMSAQEYRQRKSKFIEGLLGE